jgi:hypothetical protein
MSQLTFMLDGRESITLDALAGHRSVEPVERVMLLAVAKHVRRRVRDLACREHGQAPHVIAHGPSADRLRFAVEGCCGPLVADATGALQPDVSPEPALAG